MASDRREFLKILSGLTAAAAAGTACDTVPAQPGGEGAGEAATESQDEASLALRRDTATLKFALEINGSFGGWLVDAEGGTAVGEVVTEKLGQEGLQRKHIGNVKYEDITISCGPGMSKGFYEWVQDTLEQRLSRRDGAIVGADANLRERSRLEFENALLTELGLPALDASSKEAARMTIKFTPELTRSKKASGARIKFDVDTKGSAQRWRVSKFRLEIDGLDGATSRVSKIDALTIKQKVVEYAAGESRDTRMVPAGLEFSNLVVTLAETHAESFYAWHEDFVIRGNSDDSHEKSGTLNYTDRDGRPLFTAKFHHLGVFKVAPSRTGNLPGGYPLVKAEMYAEQVGFSVGDD